MPERQRAEAMPGVPSVFFRLIEIVSWVVIGGATIILWWTFPLIAPWQKLTIAFLLLGSVIWTFHWFLPRYGLRRRMFLPILIAQATIVGYAYYIFYPYDLSNFFIAVISVAAVLAEWQVVLFGVVLTTLINIAVRFLHAQPFTDLIVSVGFDFFTMLVTVILLIALTRIIRRQFANTARHNHDLALLLDLSAPTGGFFDPHIIVPDSAKKIALGFPVTLCRICLLSDDGKSLINYGMHPLRALPLHFQVGERVSLDLMSFHRRAIETRAPVILRMDQPIQNLTDIERQAILFENIQSTCLVPFGVEDTMIGVIDLVEARSWKNQPFDGPQIELLKTIAHQIAIVVQNAQLHQVMRKQAERFLVLNEVAHAIGSTIEMDKLLELIYQELRQVISTDTYYVALYDPNDETLDLRILIDEGERFPAAKVPVQAGLASLVISNRRPMMFSHLSEERRSLPIQPVTVGQTRSSESWLGVPLMTGDNLLGMLVVASYTPFAFNEDDRRMMANLAEQVVLALDNAHHHGEVERQSRCDSLTGAFNHGYLIQRLREEVECSQANKHPVSLIMLDIDFFKQYNDTFGHVVGDAVLRATVQAIRSHIKHTDAVGRWGGEEFSIVLHNATAEQACHVAERIRQTMAALTLTGTLGQSVPAPTVSQGIATYPDHAISADALVTEADRTLYRAKANGRDQVAIARSK
ncbi:MAG: diguanylate cyclase [Chloroflexi bacterium]|nr:diguanylate cyclase [Chloroflexota bacterium]